MSRSRKVILFLVLTPLVVVGAVVVLAFLSPVQTAIARKALAGQGEVGRVSVGLGGAELQGFVIQQPGVKISVPGFRADLPLLTAAGGSIELSALVARDIVIDYDPVAAAAHAASQPPEPKPTTESRPFAGILHAVQLPALRVDGLDVAGEIRVSGPQPVTAKFALTGGGVAAGKEGAIELKLTAKAASGADVVTTVALRPTLSTDGQLAALVVALDATAKGILLSKAPASMRAEIALAREGAGESWRVRVLATDKALLELDTRWAPGAAELPGTWKLDLADADLAPFVPFLVLPKLQLSGAGELAIANAERLSLAGELRVAADRLETLGLPALGALNLATQFDLMASATEAKVNAFRLSLDAADAPVLAIEARQTFTYNIGTARLAPARAEEELINVRLLDVPAAWVALFVPELSLGKPSGGAWSVRPDGDGFAITATAPFVLSNVRYGSAEQPQLALDALRIEGLRVRQNSTGLDASLDKLRLVAGGVDIVTLKATATRAAGAAPILARAEIGAQLAALADQPALRGQTRLSAGRALLLLDASVGEAISATSELRLSGLRADGAELPEVLLQAQATQDAAGVLTLKAPLTVSTRSPARVSDLELSATVKPDAELAGARVVTAKLLSQILHLPDLQAFAAIAAPTAPGTTPPPADGPETPAPAPSDAPLWAGVTGELELNLARIVYAPGIEVVDTKGRVALTKHMLSLDGLRALLGTGGAVDLKGALRWLPATRGYALDAEVTGADLVVGPLLRALNPTAAAPLEGIYTLAGKVSGTGSDPGAAAAGAAADFSLTGRQGLVRALDLETNQYARAGNVVSGLAGLAGALSGNPEVARRAAQVTALNNITRQFANLAYDELVLTARRGADGAIEIDTVRLLSPTLKLEGGGALANLANRTFMQQPLKMQFALGAREGLARDLATLGLVDALPAEAAPGSFAALVEPVVLEGTLSNISTTQFSRLLTRALSGR